VEYISFMGWGGVEYIAFVGSGVDYIYFVGGVEWIHSSPPPSLDNDVFHIMYGIVNYCIVAGKTYVNPLMSYRK
jgi:hypothetical protein